MNQSNRNKELLFNLVRLRNKAVDSQADIKIINNIQKRINEVMDKFMSSRESSHE